MTINQNAHARVRRAVQESVAVRPPHTRRAEKRVAGYGMLWALRTVVLALAIVLGATQASLAAAPVISGISPASANVAGSVNVFITGTDLEEVHTVLFGGVPATSFYADGPTRIVAIAPAHAPGSVDIIVVTPEGTYTEPGGFNYYNPPVVSSVAVDNPQSRPYAIGEEIMINVAFDQRITLTGTPYLNVQMGSVQRRFTLRAQIWESIYFAYTVREGDLAPGGLIVNGMELDGAVIKDVGRTTTADATLRNFADMSGNTVDGVRPILNAITPIGNPTPGASSVTFSAEFSEPVTAVDASKFVLTRSGTVQGSVDSITGSGSSYTVTVTGLSGSGTIRLGLPANTGVADVAGNQLTAAFTSAEHTVAPASIDATLSGIALSDGALDPTFDSATTSYSASVGYTISSIEVTPISADAYASVTVNGSPVLRGSGVTIPLNVGNNTISIGSIAQDGVHSASYTVEVHRAAGQAPNEPTGVSALAGDGRAIISFTPPSDPGSEPIQDYIVTAMPGNITEIGTQSPITVTNLANGTGYTFTVAANSIIGRGRESASSAMVTPLAAPMAGNVSTTVAANSVSNAISPNLAGGPPDTITIASAPTHGTASVSALSISYEPHQGYSGTDSFTYTASNGTGTSSPATVTVTVSAPTLTLTPGGGRLTGGRVGRPHAGLTIAASGGGAPYAYEVTAGALPDGLLLDPSGGTISGTPTASGTHGFTVTATDRYGASGSAAYSMVIAPAPSADFVFVPPAGALPAAMVEERYDQSIAASGGIAPLVYRLASGALPPGLALSPAGALAGTVEAGAEGDYTFSIAVRDADDAEGAVAYTLKVRPRAVTVADQSVVVPPGSTPLDIRLDKHATGGPFTEARLVSVEPAAAGTATITMGDYAALGPVTPVGWYLKFRPSGTYSGPVRVMFSLSSGLGSSTGSITYSLSYDPAEVARQMQGLARGFVETRQGLIASSINTPGLMERRATKAASTPFASQLMPGMDGMALNFATSLAQVKAFNNITDGVVEAPASPLNIWLAGSIAVHNRSENGNRWGSFSMISAGLDYLLNDKTLIGLSVHLDRMTDPTSADAELVGTGWLAGPYASVELGEGVFWDTRLLYGGSSNSIDTAFWDGSFGTNRWLFDTALSGQWRLDEATVVTPKLGVVYLSEQVPNYTVMNGTGDELTISGFTADQLRIGIGAEIARTFALDNGSLLTPRLGVTAGVSAFGGAGAFGSTSAALTLETPQAWTIDASLLLNLEGSSQIAIGAKAGASKQF